MGIDRQEGDGMCINEEHMEPCLDEQDMPLATGTESLEDIAHIQPCPKDRPVPEPSTIKEVQVEGAHHPSTGYREKEQDMVPTGTINLQDTVHIEPCPDNDLVLALVAVDEVQGWAVTTNRRRSARLRRPAPATRTQYTRGSTKQKH
ncbi:uncharacterized protein LOC111394845 isoform X2 [Olea europaea var. sylvestris]|uniref:uncharacterized protein LOC111394845 isoform X2 n=1 Tax=Olea europaea var. sylvestris TaxID=158386 RepID=UPI000C1D5145|nr:uncharacterized protein LOC111394845 isoform X2 [Olea europaea var. sylvestris]